jgi:putative transposase
MKTSIYARHRFHQDIIKRAVDNEETVLDFVVQHQRNTKEDTRLLCKLRRNQGIRPTQIVTDRLGSYGAALRILGSNIYKRLEAERTIALNAPTFQI